MHWTLVKILRAGALGGALTMLAGCSSPPAPAAPNQAERVAAAFHRMSLAVASKDSAKAAAVLIAVPAGAAAAPDGTKATLWVTAGEPVTGSRCFYLDVTQAASPTTSGQSACGKRAATDVTLSRFGAFVVGDVGMRPATVRVSSNGNTVQLPVTSGYFVVPTKLTTDPAAQFTITLMSKAGKPLGAVAGLAAPGSSTAR